MSPVDHTPTHAKKHAHAKHAHAKKSTHGKIAGLWQRLWRPSSKWLLGIPIGAFAMFVIGMVAVIGTQVMIHETGSEEFCSSACHSMKAFTTPEWKDSPHYSNPSGVRATCSDCHIPHHYPEILFFKAEAGIRDAYHEIKGTIGTRDKYEEHREEMAERVWAWLQETDSATCRTCHKDEYFALGQQDDRAARAHLSADEERKTCIDCHQGIAHRTPEEVFEGEQIFEGEQGSAGEQVFEGEQDFEGTEETAEMPAPAEP
jgi:nitrate/TMAO reductase-like tetraheme cytochrome c subunit